MSDIFRMTRFDNKISMCRYMIPIKKVTDFRFIYFFVYATELFSNSNLFTNHFDFDLSRFHCSNLYLHTIIFFYKLQLQKCDFLDNDVFKIYIIYMMNLLLAEASEMKTFGRENVEISMYI